MPSLIINGQMEFIRLLEKEKARKLSPHLVLYCNGTNVLYTHGIIFSLFVEKGKSSEHISEAH